MTQLPQSRLGLRGGCCLGGIVSSLHRLLKLRGELAVTSGGARQLELEVLQLLPEGARLGVPRRTLALLLLGPEGTARYGKDRMARKSTGGTESYGKVRNGTERGGCCWDGNRWRKFETGWGPDGLGGVCAAMRSPAFFSLVFGQGAQRCRRLLRYRGGVDCAA